MGRSPLLVKNQVRKALCKPQKYTLINEKRFSELKNDLLLRALRGEEVERPPVWMMRQQVVFYLTIESLRENYSFFERCETPELVSKIANLQLSKSVRMQPFCFLIF